MSQSSAACNRSLARRCFGNYHETGSEEGPDLLSCLCPDPGLSMGGKPFLADGAYEPQTHILKKKNRFLAMEPLCLTYKHHCPILPRLIATKWSWGEQKENSNIWMMCIKNDCSALHLEAWHKPSSCPSHLPQENSASSNSQVQKKTWISMQWLCSN